ncbi:hypothetical protein EIP91_006087 [Steccherinum ochraceum]|uniref:Glucose-methanol-choline oxidoreductase N-terminal domain-containing protein n=1 Tax=Steccherinum ochraceum TaxID=92696 RepID=A0A4R0RL32_9APHY|nr:hypothetical protein EIP91_006087 [Steccherinum ochraceum]
MLTTFDIIIAGGGATGCVIAGRLAAADANLKILIIEQGPDTKDDLNHLQPAIFARHLMPDSKTLKFVVSKPADAVGGRPIIVPAGQCVGGGSSVNFMIYTRGSASDYDDWETKHGNSGWGFNDMLPYFRKLETYQVEPNQETHGYSGPLKVSRGGIYSNIGEDFLHVATHYDSEKEHTEDTNDFRTVNKYAHWAKWINGTDGHRSDSAHNYVYNQSKNQNLVIKTGYMVKRVIFEGNRAVGVEYVPDSRFRPDEPKEVFTVRASRQVVVSADHYGVYPPYMTSEQSLTLDKVIIGDPTEIERWTPEWAEEGTGLLASNGVDAAIKLRPTSDEVKAIGPCFEERWEEHFADAHDKPALLTALPTPDIPPSRYFSCLSYMNYPASSGHLHISSGEDATAPPDFDTGYLTNPADLELLRWTYKRSREFARRMPCYRGELISLHPTFAEGSEAVCKQNVMPVPVDTPNINWTNVDDMAIDRYIRENATTSWHSLGTCPMKPRVRGGVFDARLNVYGVQGLKVADLSIAPSNVAGNTYSTVLAIAERAATIIGEDLGIKI